MQDAAPHMGAIFFSSPVLLAQPKATQKASCDALGGFGGAVALERGAGGTLWVTPWLEPGLCRSFDLLSTVASVAYQSEGGC